MPERRSVGIYPGVNGSWVIKCGQCACIESAESLQAAYQLAWLHEGTHAPPAVYCRCGAQWHGDSVRYSEAVIASHADHCGPAIDEAAFLGLGFRLPAARRGLGGNGRL